MPATLTKQGDSLVLDLSTARGVEFSEALDKIRKTAGRRYDPDTKLWSVPAEAGTADRLIFSIQPNVADDVMDWLRTARVKATDDLTTPLPPDAELLTPIAERLYPFQRAFVDLAARKRAIVNADDMGLGKTVQALAAVNEFALRASEGGPKLIVCPNSVKGVWAREIVTWLGSNEPHQIIDGSTAKARHNQLLRAIQEDAFVIVNYEQLMVKRETVRVNHRNGMSSDKPIEVLKEPLFELPFLAAAEPSLDDLDPRTIDRARTSKHRTDWFAAVLDEAHRAKNRRAKRTKGIHRVRALLKIAQTGTPIMNTPDELWSLLHWLFPDEYTSFTRFYEDYVDYDEGYFGKIITGVRNPDALRFELRERLVRRTKAQVLDLPEKIRVTIPVELSAQERAFYDEVTKQVWVDLKQESEGNDALAAAIERGDLSSLLKIPNGAARMVRLQETLEHPSNIDAERVTSSSKMDACEEIILDSKHEQHVVFCRFKHSVALFAERLAAKDLKVGVYTGETHPRDRTAMEDAFQRGEINVIVGTLAALKEGITLTASSTCHFLTRDWVPATNEQAEDRLHRNGQHDPVTIYIYEAPGTVDDGRVRPANTLKEAIVSTVLEKDDIEEVRPA